MRSDYGTRASAAALIVALCALTVQTQGDRASTWSYYGGDRRATRYSPLDQITRENVNHLRVAWRRPAIDPQLKQAFPDLSPSNYFRSTPIIIGSTLYAPDGVGLLEAFDGTSGRGVWTQEPAHPTMKEAAGESTRGADMWQNRSETRVLIVRGEYLYEIDAKTGKPISGFGDHGRVSLNRHTPDEAVFFSWTGPIVVNDVIVIGGNGGGKVGSGYGDSGFVKESTPEDIRGYDVRTGSLMWTFHVVPHAGEPGAETWGNGSRDVAGNLASWSMMSADERLGIVYLPLSAPTVSYYGGWRPGNNLYSDSLVALTAKTGKLVWYFQMVHHDLWDYDTVGPPTLADITVNGRRINAVIQGSKTGFLYVFDRATGRPVWPIEERPVPQSTVPGEHTSPTQPFPTKPPPFERQGLSEADLIDFTAALHEEAKEIVSHFVIGPMFTPPSLRSDDPNAKKGSIVLPGVYGGGNWNNGAFDPETGLYYTVSHTVPSTYDLVKPTDPKATIEYGIDFGRGESSRHTDVKGPQGLPLTKPPYGRVTAYDMNRGEIVWMVANGDGPRDHARLKDLRLPPLGIPGRPAPLLTKTLLFIGEGSNAVFNSGDGNKFRAYDKSTGNVVWETELPAGTTGAPMTYLANGKQYIVVPVGSKEHEAEWIAFSLP
jgi:quinoprotein glucose dehydrogenase